VLPSLNKGFIIIIIIIIIIIVVVVVIIIMSEAIKWIFQGCFEPQTRANNNFSKEYFSGCMRLYAKCIVRVDNNRVWPVMTKQGIKSKLKVWYDQENSHPISQWHGI